MNHHSVRSQSNWNRDPAPARRETASVVPGNVRSRGGLRLDRNWAARFACRNVSSPRAALPLTVL